MSVSVSGTIRPQKKAPPPPKKGGDSVARLRSIKKSATVGSPSTLVPDTPSQDTPNSNKDSISSYSPKSFRSTVAITTLPFKFVPDEAPSYKQQLLESEEVPSLDFSKEALATALAEPVFTKVNVTFDAKRDHIANEILTSEQIYLEKLLTLNFQYRLPMLDAAKKGEFGITEKIVESLFTRNFNEIISISNTLLLGLVDRLSMWGPGTILGDVMNDSLPLMKMYGNYASNYEGAAVLVTELLKKEQFTLFMAQGDRSDARLRSLMAEPFQRIPRYPLLLAELVKNTTEEHPDFAALSKALVKAKQVADLVNSAIMVAANATKLLSLQEMLGIEIISNGRIFMKEGPMTKLCRKGPKRRSFFLFSDVLIYATESVTKTFSKHRKIPIKALSYRDLPDEINKVNTIQIGSDAKSFKVLADTPEDKISWMDFLEQAKNNVNKAQNSFYKASGMVEVGDEPEKFMAPVWMQDDDVKSCTICGVKFTTFTRRHHCRQCGTVVCGKCSPNKKELVGQGKQRVCALCFPKAYDKAAQNLPQTTSKPTLTVTPTITITNNGTNGTQDNVGSPNSTPGGSSNSTPGGSNPGSTKKPKPVVQWTDMKVLYDFEGSEESQQLPIKVGEIVRVSTKDPAGGWWWGEMNGAQGWVPVDFVAPNV